MVRLKGYEMTERFVHGGNHDDDEDENADGGSWWCNIMKRYSMYGMVLAITMFWLKMQRSLLVGEEF